MTDPTLTLPDPFDKPEFYAGVPTKRAVAWLIDITIIGVLCTLLFVVTAVPVLLAFMGVFLLPVMMAAFGFLYRWITLAGSSATWGMRIMALQIREADGARLSSGTALLHTIGYTVCVSTGMLQLVSIVTMLVTDRKQSVPDLILNTAAINRPAPGW